MHRPPHFSVDVAAHPGGVVVAPRGDIDIATVDEVRAPCRAAERGLVLDLRAVEFLDTSALHLVVECRRRADTDGVPFAVVRGRASVQRLFEIAGLNDWVRFVDDPAEALPGGGPAG